MIENGIWVGVTESDIKKIRQEKKSVVIKEGIRFVPVFALTLAVTMILGTLIPLL